MSQSYWVPLYLVYKLIFTTPNSEHPQQTRNEQKTNKSCMS